MHLFYTRLLIYSTPVWRPADLGSYHHSPLRVSGVLATSACTLSALLVALGPVIRIPPQFQDPPRLEPSPGSMEPTGDSAWRPLAITLASAAITPAESLPHRDHDRDRADRPAALRSHASGLSWPLIASPGTHPALIASALRPLVTSGRSGLS